MGMYSDLAVVSKLSAFSGRARDAGQAILYCVAW